MKISLLHVSRGRPQIAAQTAAEWIGQAGTLWQKHCEYHMVVESDDRDAYETALKAGSVVDHLLVCPPGRLRLAREDIDAPNFSWPDERDIDAYYWTANTKARWFLENSSLTWHWVVCVADNFMPARDWLRKAMPYFEKFRQTQTLLLYHYHDWRKLASHPIMTREMIRARGCQIHYCGYYHTHGDADLYLEAALQKATTVLPPELDPTHHHPSHDGIAPDALFWLNNHAETYQQGETVWRRRRPELLGRYGQT